MKLLFLLILPFSVLAADNSIYIDQVGSNNQVTIIQTGSPNSVGGVNQQAAPLQGDYNQISITQYSSNTVKLDITGDYNNLTSNQSVGHYVETTITGNNNTLNFNQINNGNKSITASISGNNNEIGRAHV